MGFELGVRNLLGMPADVSPNTRFIEQHNEILCDLQNYHDCPRSGHGRLVAVGADPAKLDAFTQLAE
jgi:hypothetical protein